MKWQTAKVNWNSHQADPPPPSPGGNPIPGDDDYED